MKNKPKSTWIVTTVIAIFAIVAGTYYSTRSKEQTENSNAAADAAFVFSPSSLIANLNTQIVTKLNINPTTNSVTAVDVNLTFDPAKTAVNSVTNTGPFTQVLKAPVIDNVAGTVSFTYGIPLQAGATPAPVKATSEIASISLSTKNLTGAATIQVSNTSKAAAIGIDTSVSGSYGLMQLNIVTSVTPSPTPTTPPIVTPSPSASPTATATSTTATYPDWDVNRDSKVNVIDIGIIIDNYDSTSPSNPRADVNKNGRVDVIDIGIVVDHYQ